MTGWSPGPAAGAPASGAAGARADGFYALWALDRVFALPMLWLAAAPFDERQADPAIPDFTLRNFRALRDNPYALWLAAQLRSARPLHRALALLCGGLAAYSLSLAHPRPGRALYLLLLLSSIVNRHRACAVFL